MTAELSDITADDFTRYEDVRVSGVCNMWSPNAERIAGISTETKLGIMKHYKALCDQWPHIPMTRLCSSCKTFRRSRRSGRPAL